MNNDTGDFFGFFCVLKTNWKHVSNDDDFNRSLIFVFVNWRPFASHLKHFEMDLRKII